MAKVIKLVESPIQEKKYRVYLEVDGKERHVDFGQYGAKDFTKTKEEARKALYLERHRAREDWTKSGILTAGFWARWILWNRKTIAASLADVKQRFDL
jgi:hypothetical protein